MKRPSGTALSRILLGTAFAVIVLWTTSYWRAVAVGYYARQGSDGFCRDYKFYLNRGRLGYTWSGQDDPSTPVRGRVLSFVSHPRPRAWTSWVWSTSNTSVKGIAFAGFYFERSKQKGMWWHTVTVPLWFILSICVTGSALARRGRMVPGVCRHCGYDLRATPERCPECGTAATRDGPAAAAAAARR